MHRRKKAKKKKPERPAALTPDEETFINSLLQDLKDTDPTQLVERIPNPSIAKNLIERLPLHEAPPISLLSALNEGFKDKEVSKALKRLLFKLKKKGLSTEGLYPKEERSDIILKVLPKEEPAAYLGPVDSAGFRAVLITFQRSAKGVDLGLGLVSDEYGIKQFLFGNFSKKRLKEIKEDLFGEVGRLVEASLSHTATILEDAYRRHLELHSEVPADYLELRPWLLENASLLDRPAIYDLVSEASYTDMILTDSQLERLFEHNLMDSWVIDFEEMRPYMEDILKVDDSPIVLTETQKADRERQIREKAMEELFPSPKRTLLKHRLEEMAYVFFKLDEAEHAGICMAAAQSLDQEESILRKNSVIEFLLTRSIDFYANATHEPAGEQDQEDNESSGIILP